MSDDLRDRLARFLDEQEDDVVKGLVEAIFTAVKDEWVTLTCKHCGKPQRLPAPVPDIVARVKAFDLLTTQAKGKPVQTVRHSHDGTIGLRMVETMTMPEIEAELAAVRARRQIPAGPAA